MPISSPRGGFSFLKGGSPFSSGVAASPGFAIVHARLAGLVPWRTGFEKIDAHLRSLGRPRQALCAIALRSPAPFTFEGFKAFNGGYQELLASWELHVDGLNPVARTNVAPGIHPPAEPCLYSFAYTVPADDAPPSFVVAGAGEVPDGSSGPQDVVRRGESSPDAMIDKARCVLDHMERRLTGLGVGWEQVTCTNVYTVHDLHALLAAEILPRLGPAARHGVTWHYTRPPIVSIEFEMDVRGCAREIVL